MTDAQPGPHYMSLRSRFSRLGEIHVAADLLPEVQEQDRSEGDKEDKSYGGLGFHLTCGQSGV